MKTSMKLLAAALLATAWSGSLQAGHQVFNFDTDPGIDPSLSSAIIIGTHYYGNALGFSQIWSSGAGVATNGTPKTGGFLSICDATNNNNNLVFVFPDVDGGLPVKGFQIDLDLRVGNPNASNGRPADGFSISFARDGDVALQNATNGVAGGFAGGDGSAANAASPAGSTDVENGTKSGVAVVFDAWQGNWLPDTQPINSTGGSNDREGFAVRLDDRTLIQLDRQTYRNWRDCATSTQTLATVSVQTGSNALVTAGFQTCNQTYGNTESSGSFTNLFWQHLMVKLTNNPAPQLTVTWKGITLIQTNLPAFSPSVGRLVLAGRCGGNNQNVHADNIVVDTTPSPFAYLRDIQAQLNGFIFNLSDVAGSAVQSVTQVLLVDNASGVTNDVTAQTTITSNPPLTTGTYSQATRFAAGSVHTVFVTFVDDHAVTSTGAILFTVPNYVLFPTSYALPLSAVDTSKPGFLVSPYQFVQNNPNQAWWTEEAFIGLHGTNAVAASTLPNESGLKVWDGPLGFTIAQTTPFFTTDGDFANFGIGPNYPTATGPTGVIRYNPYDNMALELFAYVYFPTSGIYNMCVGSDDSFQISVSQNTRDRMGKVLWFNNGSRVPNAAAPPLAGPDIRQVIIDQPGVYPVRILYENGGGGAALEWYTCDDTFSSPGFGAFLVNDTNNVSGPNGTVIKTYRALSGTVDVGPYVLKANPVRGGFNAVSYQPVVIDLADGTGSKTVNETTVALSVDGAAQTVTTTRSGSTVHIVQTLASEWSSGAHTNLLTFNDGLGTTYTYSWAFNVLGGALGLAAIDKTNTAAIVQVPVSASVSAGLVDTSKPGFRVNSYQIAMEAGQSDSGFADAELQGQHGINIAGTNPNGYFTWNDLVDFRYSSGNGAVGEWVYDRGNFYDQFGIGVVEPNLRINITPSNSKTETSVLEWGAWFVFPTAGDYIMHVNSDDGFRVMVPQGTPFGRIGTTLVEANVGRGVAGAAGFAQTGGTMFRFHIPAAGAYPFRMVYFNGGTDGGLEWSIYQTLADGSVGKVPINDPSTPTAIKMYQTLTSGPTVAPYIKHLDPVYNEPDVVFWEPITVDIADGPTGMTINSASILLFSDGRLQNVAITTPSAGVTRVVQQMPPAYYWSNGSHTNLLAYQDSASTWYTNIWPFRAIGPNFNVVQLPASQMVPTSQVDHTKPGFRIKSYQTTAANTDSAGNPRIYLAEAQFLGQLGPNIADQTFAPNGYFVWTNEIDFTENAGNATQVGEYRQNNGMVTNFGFVYQGGGTRCDYNALIFAGWMEFPKAGIYGMTVNSDDGFKVSSPFGSNPFTEAGIILGVVDSGRGNTSGGAANPFRGSVSSMLFNIPAPGAYPIRCLYYNGTGGVNIEWTLFQYMADGSVERVLIQDPGVPDAVKVYQTLTTVPPSVVNTLNGNTGLPLTNAPLTLLSGQPSIALGGTGGAQTIVNIQDVFVLLQDGSIAINPSTVALSLNGVVQPITITNGNGFTGVFRFATNGMWPSGAYGPLLVTYQDTAGTHYTNNAGYVTTPFWGMLHGGLPSSSVDTTKPGFKVRAYQVDPAINDMGTNQGAVTTSSLVTPNRTHVAEQILAGIWGPNQANPAATTFYPGGASDGGYFDLQGTGPTNGVINVNAQYPAQAGDFQGAGFFDQPMPGIPGLGPTTINTDRSNCVALEILAYVEFPTNGTYTLGVSSDDGFRLTQTWTPPANKGAMIVNSPAGVAGVKATVMNAAEQPVSSCPLTNVITGNLILANGIGFGSQTNGEGCVISNPGELTGNIALFYRSPNANGVGCSALTQVFNAASCGARAVVIIQKRRPVTDGVLPEEFNITPMQPIPMVMIEEAEGNALIAAMATNVVNVTLTPLDDMLNPTDDNVLGQSSIGKGNSDCNFNVVVTNAPAVYPLRLVYWNGSGGVNVEFYSLTGASAARRLVNDLSSTSGIGLRAFYALNAALPTISIATSGGNVIITYTGTLQSSATVNGTYTDVTGATSPYTVPTGSAPMQFYRARN